MTFGMFYEADWSILIPSSLLSNKLTPKFLNQFVCFIVKRTLALHILTNCNEKLKTGFSRSQQLTTKKNLQLFKMSQLLRFRPKIELNFRKMRLKDNLGPRVSQSHSTHDYKMDILLTPFCC